MLKRLQIQRSDLPAVVIFCLVLGVGINILVQGYRNSTLAARAVTAKLVQADNFDEYKPGELVVVEGQISPRNRLIWREFVAYYTWRYDGSDDNGNEQWTEIARDTPPLMIDTPNGTITMANNNYAISLPSASWQDQPTLRINILNGSSTKRTYGFVLGVPVMALGTIVAGAEGNLLQTEIVSGGNRDRFIATQNQDSRWRLIIGWVWVVLTVAGFGYLVVLR